MVVETFLQVLHDIGAYLCARTCNDHTTLERLARSRPITGSPVTGYRTLVASAIPIKE